MQLFNGTKAVDAVDRVLDALGLGKHRRTDELFQVIDREVLPAIDALKKRATHAEAELKRGKMVGQQVDPRYAQIEVYGEPKKLYEELQAAKAEIDMLKANPGAPQRIGPPYGDDQF